ncbi:1,4-dihydroxy-2-naphthoyl-CoA hydrolase [Thalassoporum mexicanum PCC 7367]|uniref:acyl-CoA thioesterase n=1 Tax=Thalassoporum mexicanum TaxID=3457544 RepID=UPI00029FD7C9|nr:thioesterase family protein [Pseudanabaena sp. PCC 7367]AFY71360.1 1,4-dihydroxy-2-naphthoyl-CoA hydrolase [Pseudanabaena sp. PCC 7367]
MYIHQRQIYFKDTDAAGVVYFANALSICHESYEAALRDFGVDVREFFSDRGGYAVPIVHAEIDFYQPVFCGDRLVIQVLPEQRSLYSFQINYQIFANCEADLVAQDIQLNAKQKPCAKAITQHVCISTSDRRKTELPDQLTQWLANYSPTD